MADAWDWMAEAVDDLKAAKALLDADFFAKCAFHCQQAAEKALKALLNQTKGSFPFTHDLEGLAKTAGAASSILEAARYLTPAYTMTRYAGIATDRPAKAYSMARAKQHIDSAEVILKWVRSRLSR